MRKMRITALVKGVIALMINVLCGVCVSYAQEGVWSGALEVQGVKLPVVFHLTPEGPTMDSPAQNVRGIPIEVTRPAADSIFISVPMIGGSFSGRYEDGKIRGVFSQRGVELPLTLSPGEEEVRRPQTPQPPFPYGVEEVSFANGEAVLRGTLTLPLGYTSATPVVLMVTGSGLQNRDEEVFDHKPFAVIADALARGGIASLRYDDRGFGESTGDPVNCTTEDLMRDALAGVDLLRERFRRVGVLGHSEGGTIGLMLGAEGKVDFVVSLAGMVISGRETLLDQNRDVLRQAGLSEEMADEYCSLLSLVFDGDSSVGEQLDSSVLPPEWKQNMRAVMRQLQSPYLQYFVALDLRPQLSKIACPVLALNGMKDTQVAYGKNLDALREGLPPNSKSRIEAMPDLNHPFQHCRTGLVTEYATIEETISPEVLEILCEWISATE